MQKQNATKVEGIMKKTSFKQYYSARCTRVKETQIFSLPSKKYAKLQAAIRDCNIFYFGKDLDIQLTEEIVYKNMLIWSDSTSEGPSPSENALAPSMSELSTIGTIGCSKCKYRYTVLRNSARKEDYCPACGEAGDVYSVAPFRTATDLETSNDIIDNVSNTCNLKLQIKYTLDRFGKHFKLDGHLLSAIAIHLFNDQKMKMHYVVSKVVSAIIMRLNPNCIKDHKIKQADLRVISSSSKAILASKKMGLRDSVKINKKVKFLTNPPPLPPRYL